MITKEKSPIRVLFFRDHGKRGTLGAGVPLSARPAPPGMPEICSFVWLEQVSNICFVEDRHHQ
ncbi:MAG TPA: hypothetical protein VMG13_02835 [Trebonia sp.]|nr:hypothetical protein [Trebonia sp.]